MHYEVDERTSKPIVKFHHRKTQGGFILNVKALELSEFVTKYGESNKTRNVCAATKGEDVVD